VPLLRCAPFVKELLPILLSALAAVAFLSSCEQEESSKPAASSTPASPYHNIPGATHVGH